MSQNGQYYRRFYTQGKLTRRLDDPQVIDPALLDLSRPGSENFGIDPQLLDVSPGDHGSAGTGVEPISHSPENHQALLQPPEEFSRAQNDVLGGVPGDVQAPDSGSKATMDMPGPQGRGLPRRRSRYLTRNAAAQSGPVFIPNASSLDPMERWRNSPPEEEPALIPDIIDALKTAPEPPEKPSGSRGNNAFRDYRHAVSTTSGESSASSRDSQQSGRSSSSGRGRFRAGKNTRKKQNNTNVLRRYCCTFCCDKFKSKYDWARHEKSLHVTLEAWYCAPFGTTIPSTPGETLCAFCGITNPTQAHINTHEPTACETPSSPGTRRSFRRKDHLVQHLRLVHNITAPIIPPSLESWKVGHSSIPCRCGFCSKSLSTWDQRTEHLADHFRRGLTMSSWTGEHDFPPDFAALVANALPPYLIASESHSCIPFSATNCDVQDHFAQISSRAVVDAADETEASTIAAPQVSSVALPLRAIAPGVAPEQLSLFTQVLTLHLSRFAQEQIRRGVVPSDEMFQRESRRVLYDSDDSWNQTIADNPEWMMAFRGLHCDGGEGGAGNAGAGVD